MSEPAQEPFISCWQTASLTYGRRDVLQWMPPSPPNPEQGSRVEEQVREYESKKRVLCFLWPKTPVTPNQPVGRVNGVRNNGEGLSYARSCQVRLMRLPAVASRLERLEATREACLRRVQGIHLAGGCCYCHQRANILALCDGQRFSGRHPEGALVAKTWSGWLCSLAPLPAAARRRVWRITVMGIVPPVSVSPHGPEIGPLIRVQRTRVFALSAT